MRAKFLHGAVLWTFLFAATLTTGCSDDNDYKDVDGQKPVVELIADHIHVDPGSELTLTATITDADGIRSIRLQNAELYLDKTIDLLSIYGEPLYSYELEYAITLSEKLPRMADYPIIVTITDVGGRSVEHTIMVSTDNDSEKPTIKFAAEGEFTTLTAEDGTVPFHFIVEDEQALDYVEVSIPSLELVEKVDAEGKTKFDGVVRLPIEQSGTYDVKLKVVDKFANEETTTTSYTVKVVAEMPDFQKMYLSDVEDASQLTSDVFGVPMRIERTGAYTYKANYYSQKAGTEIYFIPQKADIYPICFGRDPNNLNKLVSDPSIAEPIVLEQANVYYEITFNISDNSYSMSTYSIEQAIDPAPHEFGSISLDTWNNGGSWLQEFYFGYMTDAPKNIQRFEQDNINPHLFYLKSLSLKANTQMNFIIHNWHHDNWWDYCAWYVDKSEGADAVYDPEVFGYFSDEKAVHINPAWQGTMLTRQNKDWAKPTVKTAGDYKLIFDAHLGRVKLIPVDNK